VRYKFRFVAHDAKAIIGNIGYLTGVALISRGTRLVWKQAANRRMERYVLSGSPSGAVDDDIARDRREAP
jgi:hypothetical protein